jgi:hypothetical protein
MQRIFGAIAVFLGWLCIPLSAVFGLAGSQFLGLDHTEGALPPSNVYGMPEIVLLWGIVALAVFASIPVASAIFAANPRTRLYGTAAILTIAAVVLLPDELGRFYSVALLPGAGLFAAGGWLIPQAGAIDPAAGSAAPAGALPVGVSGTPVVSSEPLAQTPVAAPVLAATPVLPAGPVLPAPEIGRAHV